LKYSTEPRNPAARSSFVRPWAKRVTQKSTSDWAAVLHGARVPVAVVASALQRVVVVLDRAQELADQALKGCWRTCGRLMPRNSLRTSGKQNDTASIRRPFEAQIVNSDE
jgi:hypothetical protein